MEEELKFSTPTTFLGRNGRFKAIGMRISAYGTEVNFTPVTSKNELGRGMLHIPKTDLPEMIRILTSML